jgi:hypothetical protein
VLASESNFVDFLHTITSALNSGDRSLTCEAIVRHPALLDATTAMYGGAVDDTVIHTDCDQSLPPTPALSALSDKLDDAWFSTCKGTLRFSLESDYQMTLASARLGLTKHAPKTAPARFHGIRAAEIAAALSELAAYYVQYLGKPHQTAKTMAQDAIDALFSEAHLCDPG